MRTAALLQRHEDAPMPPAQRIAEAIIERLEHHGQCSIADIQALGFSINDIARYWPEACRLAEAQRPRNRNGGQS